MTSPYLKGHHAPVPGEREARDLPVWGELPGELSGMFARNTPNPRFAPPGRYHWFDGDGMIHALRFQDGRASYQNRWVRTPGLAAEEELGEAIWGGILDPVDLSNPRGPIKDTANTHLIAHQGALLATWWLSGRPAAVSPTTLETLPPPSWLAALGKRTVAAHPKVDPRTGELFFMGYGMGRAPYAWVGVVSAEGELLRCEETDAAGPRIPHDIGFTDRFVVLLDLPLGWDRRGLAEGKRRIGFDREGVARIGLWPRAGGPVRWFEVPPCYVYHLTSSYETEDGAQVVLTGCRVDDPIPDVADATGTIPRLDLIHLAPVATRWTLDLVTGGVTVETLDDTLTEFPTVRDDHWGRPTRYAYHPRLARHETIGFDGLIRLDHATGARQVLAYPPGWLGGEVQVAARPGSTREDDAWVVTVLTHPDHPASEAWVLRAEAIEDGPVAKITLPWRIPLGFHSAWVPSAA